MSISDQNKKHLFHISRDQVVFDIKIFLILLIVLIGGIVFYTQYLQKNITSSHASEGTPVVTTYLPTGDTYANQSSPSNTYGTKSPLITKYGSSTKKNIFLKFDLTKTAATSVSGATLRLKVSDGSTDIQNYRMLINSIWDEKTLSWKNQPALSGAVIATTSKTTAGSWIAVPLDAVASQMQGKQITIVIETPTGSDVFGIESRETPDAPQLLLTTYTSLPIVSPTIQATVAPTTVVTAIPATSVPTVIQPTIVATLAPTAVIPTALVQPTNGPITVTGKTYYVATTGSDTNPGTIDQPFKTLNSSFAKLRPGDLLYVRGGEYKEIVSPSLTKGTAASPIQVVAYSGERPVIKGLFIMSDASYWTVNGINVTWDGVTTGDKHMVKFTGGEHWTLTNSEIWNAHAFAGLSITGFSTNWVVTNSYIHDTADCRTQCLGTKHTDNQDHLIYVNDSSYGTIEHSIFVGSPNGRGVKLGPPSGSGGPNHIVIRYNTFYNNVGPANIQLSYGSSYNEIYRNIMQKSKSGSTNVTNNSINGLNNVVHDNIGWESAGVVESDPTYLKDTGGNKYMDPQLDFATYKPKNTTVAGYGRFAAN